MMDFYNSEMSRVEDVLGTQKLEDLVSLDPSKISWTAQLKIKAHKGFRFDYSEKNTLRISTYRPFIKENMYFDRAFNETIGLSPLMFPEVSSENRIICVSGIGSSKGFSSFIVDTLSEYQMISNGQCFPLYWYEENKVIERSLFDDDSTDDKYIRRDGITDWILKEVRKRFGNSKAITKEHIFYYVYGILHSPQYRERFAADLKKSLPRIPIVDDVQDFMAFYKAGKALAELHLNYEQVPSSPDVTAHIADAVYTEPTDDAPFGYTKYDHFRVLKMVFPKVRNEAGKLVPDKSRIIYNDNITIENIPAKAYEYIVNGKSAIEWIMERYAVTQDSKSLITNDPNDWSKEHGNSTYIYDLLLSVINLSVQTVDIVNSLPKLKL